MVFDWLRRKGDDLGKEVKGAIQHGVLTADTQRPRDLIEQRQLLGINLHTIEDDNIIDTINMFINYCTNHDYIDFHLFALRNLITKLLRTSHLERIDAYILMMQGEQILLDIESNLPDDLIALGVLAYIDSIKVLLESAFCDAIGGWKAKLLKFSPTYHEITIPESKKQKPWMGE